MNRRELLKLLGLGTLSAAQAALLPVAPFLASSRAERHMLHYIHPDHPVGDIHPFFHSGTWYAFYLGPGFTSRLITSSDLLHWQEVALTHTPPNAENPELAPYYVLDVFQDPSGLFRTYHGWSGGEMHSHISTDLTNWDFAPASFRVPAQLSRYSSQRDPYVFWNESESAYWCVMTCKTRDLGDDINGAVGFSSSTDLQHWQGRGHLYFPNNQEVRPAQRDTDLKLEGKSQWCEIGAVFRLADRVGRG
ncbi:MAG: glycoside hydrolase family protein [Aggregatilineales bacterium]